MKRQNRKLLLQKTILCLGAVSVVFISFAGLLFPKQTHAQFAPPPPYLTTDPGLYAIIKTEDAEKKANTIWENAFYGLVRNFMNVALSKLAYDSATWIASAGTGQQALVYNKSVGDYVADVGDAAIGGAIEGFATGLGWDAAKICNPDLNLQLKLGLDLDLGGGPYEPACKVSELMGNWNDFVTDPNFSDRVSLQWDPAANPLGQAMKALSYVSEVEGLATQAAELERTLSSFKDQTEKVSGWVTTPSTMIEQQWEQTGRESGKGWDLVGKPGADALGIFSNTLISKLFARLQAGFLGPAGTPLSELIAGSSGGRTTGASAAATKYASLNKPNFISTGTYDVVTELNSCFGEGETADNCVLGSTMATAINQGWTVGEFIGYMSDVQGNEEFKFALDEIENPEEGISYAGVIVLKKYRIVPVGWQLAAEYIRSDITTESPTLKQLVDCYDVCGSSEDVGECSETITYTDSDGIEVDTYYSPFCRLVDPSWVLKAPENFCAKEAPGPYKITDSFTDTDNVASTQETRTISRSDYCADSRGCIAEEQEDVCTAHGYCTKEKRIFRMSNSESCNEDLASCQTFEIMEGDNEGEEVSYLKNTLNYDDCASHPGCKWYCLAQDDNGSFICKDQDTVYSVCDEEQPTYFTNESCTCEVTESCWVDAGSGSEDDQFRVCDLGSCSGSDTTVDYNIINTVDGCAAVSGTWSGSGYECDLGDNCGASSPYYTDTGVHADYCYCSAANSCEVEVDLDSDLDGDGDVDSDDAALGTASSCTHEYSDDYSIECNLDANCSTDDTTYVSSGYCSASDIGDNCVVQNGETTCINDLGNTCELSGVCGTDITPTIDDEYCECAPSADSCDINSGSYSCTSESANKVVLGTEDEDTYGDNVSINFDNDLEECDQEEASCSHYYRIQPDTNLLYNSSFETIDDNNSVDDGVQDFFGFYGNTGAPCDYTRITDSTDSAYVGECIGWQQHSVSTQAVTDDNTSYSISNDYGQAILIPVSTTSDSISNTIETGQALGGRTFTFAYRAMAPDENGGTPLFKIAATNGSVNSNEINIPTDLTDEDKAEYEYFTDDGTGVYSTNEYSSDYTDYYYTYTFPTIVTDTKIKVEIFASDVDDIAIDIAALYENLTIGQWGGEYYAYGENNITYLKTQYLECAAEDIGCELFTPTDDKNAVAIPAQITNPYSDTCGNGEDFTDPNCNQCNGNSEQGNEYYVGCDFYQEMPLENIVPVSEVPVSWSLSTDVEKQGLAERTGYYCEGTQTSCADPSDTYSQCGGAACVNTISLIPNTADSCSVADVGCEEYTNLDSIEAGGEGLEYYSFIKQCVKPTDTEVYTYHAWEGSDSDGYAMVLHNLKQSDADSGPCTHLDVSSEEPNAGCIDSSEGIDDCTAVYGEDPDCVKYYDDDLNVYYRYQTQTVSVSEDCIPYRNSNDQRAYYTIADESISCDAKAVGCREYQGSDSGSVEQIVDEEFSDNSTENWSGAWSTSNESLYTDDYSLHLDSGYTDSDGVSEGTGDATTASAISYNLYSTSEDVLTGETTYSSDVDAGSSYVLSFWAKGDGNLLASLSSADLTATYYFTDTGSETDSTLSNITLTDSWTHFIIGPVYIPSTENTDTAALSFSYTGNSASAVSYIDNVIVEKSSSQYLIKDSFDTCYDYEGCEKYLDRDKQENYLKSFERLCENSEVGCQAMINTFNSSNTEFTQEFLTDNEYSRDDVVVPYDQIQSYIYDTDYLCSSQNKGCQKLGLPDVNEQTNIIDSITNIYGLVNPDNFASVLCEDPQLQCKEYYSEFDGTSYFKDPGDRLCQYKSYSENGVTLYGWFKRDTDATAPDCPKQYYYAAPSQPLGPVCNSNSGDKVGKMCNTDYDCFGNNYSGTPRCISRAEDDIDQDTTDAYSMDTNQDFGWVGECDAEASGCSEYIDPNSPNIEELVTNGGFEDNVRNNVELSYFDDGATDESLPDYWAVPDWTVDYSGAEETEVIETVEDGIANWQSTDGTAECFEIDDSVKYRSYNSVKLSGNCQIMSENYIDVERDKLYTLELFFRVPEAAQTGDSEDYYKQLDIGGYFYSDASGSMEVVSATPDQAYFVAQDLQVSSEFYEEGDDVGYSQWLRLSANIGVGSTVEIPEGAKQIKLFIKNSDFNTAPVSDELWIDELSFKQNDKYYLIDYTVDGTDERIQFDNTQTCIDQDTEDKEINSEGSCVAFRDVLRDAQDYEQLGTSCNSCEQTPNSDSCRGVIDACDSNSVFKVKLDRVCDEWIACQTSQVIESNTGQTDYVCLALSGCNEMNDEGQCTSWLIKPTYDELDYDSDLTYYVHSGDADELYEMQNYSGYVKVGLMWGDIGMCDGGWNEGNRCSTDTDCIDEGVCTFNKADITETDDHTFSLKTCVGGQEHKGEACDTSEDCVGDDNGYCTDKFTIEGYYPYAFMPEAGETGVDTGQDLIEFNDFEGLYCQGKKFGNDNTPCVRNSYDSGAIDRGNCWQTNFEYYLEDDETDNNPIEGNPNVSGWGTDCGGGSSEPCTSSPDSADYFCPNTPAFNEWFPFKRGEKTVSGWSGMNDCDEVIVSQYEDPYEDNLNIDINNVLHINPDPVDTSEATRNECGDLADSVFNGGVMYDLQDDIQQGGYYALSFKARYTDSYNYAGSEKPTSMSIGLRHNNIFSADDTSIETENTDWFVSGLGMADIIFVVDTSSTMDNLPYTDSDGTTYSTGGPIGSVKQAAPAIAEDLAARGINTKFALVDMDQDIYDGTTQNTNTLDLNLNSNLEVFSNAVSSYLIAYNANVDPFNAIDQVINNTLPYTDSDNTSLTSPSISYRDDAQKFIIMVTDTYDELSTNGMPDENYYENLASSGFTVYTITNSTYASIYSDLANYSGGTVYENILDADWSATGMADDIAQQIINSVDIFQLSRDFENYTLGPIQVEERLPCSDSAICDPVETTVSGYNITTDLIFSTNDGVGIDIDDVSLLPVLEVNKSLDPIKRGCRAYSDASDPNCNYIEPNGVQHRGWMGYCLETDPENTNNCITWWPLDVIAGESSLFGKEQGGYSGRSDVYMCLISKGYERLGYCDADNTTAGSGRICKPSYGYDDTTGFSYQCTGSVDRCFTGANYYLGENSSDYGATKYNEDIDNQYYRKFSSEGAGECEAGFVDGTDYTCDAYPGSGEGYCDDGTGTDTGDDEDACDDNSSYEWTTPETVDAFVTYASTGKCMGYMPSLFSLFSDSYVTTDGNYCFYDSDENGVYEVRTSYACSSDNECKEIGGNLEASTTDSAANYSCALLNCNKGESIQCDPDNFCSDEKITFDYSPGAYQVQTHRWQMHDPYQASGNDFNHMIVTRLPANAIEKNVNISEIEKIDLFLGNAGQFHGADEARFWGQEDPTAPTEDGVIEITDLVAGAIPQEDGDTGPWDHCGPASDGKNRGVGCFWWGQYDSEGKLDNIEAGNYDQESETQFDLVYVYGWSNYMKGEKPDGDEKCKKNNDDSPKYSWNDIYGGTYPSYYLESPCIDRTVKYVMDTAGSSNNNPWTHMEDIISDLGSATDDTNETWGLYTMSDTDGWKGFDTKDTNQGGNIYSIYLDFDSNGYLNAIYTMVYHGADNIKDYGRGVMITGENMIHMDYYLREPCLAVAQTVSSSGDNTAWAKRAGGDSSVASLFDGVFSYTEDTEPWGSISPMSNSIGKQWDSLDESEGTNLYLATTHGEQPIFSWAPEESSTVNAGKPYACIGQCLDKYCVKGDEEKIGDTCTDGGSCGDEGVCVGVDNSDDDGNVINWAGEISSTSREEQLSDVADSAQSLMKYIFANIIDDPYEVDFTQYDAAALGIYKTNGDLWADNASSPATYSGMNECSGNERPDDDADIGTISEYCGVRPSIENVAIDGNKSGGTYDITQGQAVNLTFDSLVDSEQTELRKIYIDWGDGNWNDIVWDAEPGSHNYTHAYTCRPEQSSYALEYDSGVACYYRGTITLVDNWGWCSGDRMGTCTKPDASTDDLTEDHCNLYGGSWAGTSDDYRYLFDKETDSGENVRAQCGSYELMPFTIKVEVD